MLICVVTHHVYALFSFYFVHILNIVLRHCEHKAFNPLVPGLNAIVISLFASFVYMCIQRRSLPPDCPALVMQVESDFTYCSVAVLPLLTSHKQGVYVSVLPESLQRFCKILYIFIGNGVFRPAHSVYGQT